MNRIGVATWITIGTLALAGVVWAVRLEGRVYTNDQAIVKVDERHRENVAQFREDLRYIRGRLDDLVDGRRPAPTTGTAPTPAFHLKVRPRFGFAPLDAEVRLQVEPGGVAREVLVELAGPDYYRSSLFPIRSSVDAPTVQPPAWYRSLPPGDYTVVATLTERRCASCRGRVVLARRELSLGVRGRGEP